MIHQFTYSVGDFEDNFVNEYFDGFVIYLHEKGQFWLSSPMEKLGQPKELYIPRNTEQES